MKYSKNNFIIYNVISCLRRFKDEEYMNKIAEELLFTFFALFDYFYLNLKKKMESDSNSNSIGVLNSFELMTIKELIGLLGNIAKSEIHQKPFIEKNMHLVFIDMILSFIDYPKIIKNTLGAMINLTSNNQIRDEISKVAAFVKCIYLVLQKYKDAHLVIDYMLKLLINILKNGKNFFLILI